MVRELVTGAQRDFSTFVSGLYIPDLRAERAIVPLAFAMQDSVALAMHSPVR